MYARNSTTSKVKGQGDGVQFLHHFHKAFLRPYGKAESTPDKDTIATNLAPFQRKDANVPTKKNANTVNFQCQYCKNANTVNIDIQIFLSCKTRRVQWACSS